MKWTSRKALWKTIERLNLDIESFRGEKLLYLEKISNLEQVVAAERKRADEATSLVSELGAIQTTIKEKALPKCESELCAACAHCLEGWANGTRKIIGCRKDIECADYKAKPQTQYIPYPQPIPTYSYYPVSAHDALMSQINAFKTI